MLLFEFIDVHGSSVGEMLRQDPVNNQEVGLAFKDAFSIHLLEHAKFSKSASLAFFVEFMFARNLFCRYACAVGLSQSLAWMANDKAMVVGFSRARASDCATCFSACDHVCPMRLTPRNVKRMMFACVQCGQCVDACDQTQDNNPNGSLLDWVEDQRAASEASFNVGTARTIMLKQIKNDDAPTGPGKN